jgi:hypothetical protein
MSVDLHFVGLFCHASYNGDEFVVAPTGPTDPVHHFRVLVDKQYVDASTTAGYDQAFADPNGTERSYKNLAGNLTLGGIAMGGTHTTTPSFDAQVPRLTAVSDHRLLSSYITTKTVGGDVQSLIPHPPGALGLVKSFMEQATFYPSTGGWPAAGCIAAITSLLLPTTGAPITITNGGSTLILAPNVGTITFLNMPLDFAAYHGDFTRYYRAFFQDTAAESRPVAAGTCPGGWRVNSVECSNSQYP